MPRWMIQSFFAMLKFKVEFIVLNSLVEYSQSTSARVTLPSWSSQRGRGENSPAGVPQSPQHFGEQVPGEVQTESSDGRPNGSFATRQIKDLCRFAFDSS
jgi:hypothetical protein